MEQVISKSQFKPRALQYFREVQEKGVELIITDHGKPVVKIVPYLNNHEDALKRLRNTVLKYEDPTEPVGLEEWEALS
ncbi:type II toxin-antitoxin system Phd/YefM family antitoxin [Thermodesulfobacteriota bacterium]